MRRVQRRDVEDDPFAADLYGIPRYVIRDILDSSGGAFGPGDDFRFGGDSGSVSPSPSSDDDDYDDNGYHYHHHHRNHHHHNHHHRHRHQHHHRHDHFLHSFEDDDDGRFGNMVSRPIRPMIRGPGNNVPVSSSSFLKAHSRRDYHDDDNTAKSLTNFTKYVGSGGRIPLSSKGFATLGAGGRSVAVGNVLTPVAYGFMAAEAGKAISDDVKRGTTRNTLEKTASIAGTCAGSTAGAAAGAAIGSAIFPGVGTVVGGIAGAIFGGDLGSKGAQKTTEIICDEIDYDIEWRRCEQCGRRFRARMYRSENERRYCDDCR